MPWCDFRRTGWRTALSLLPSPALIVRGSFPCLRCSDATQSVIQAVADLLRVRTLLPEDNSRLSRDNHIRRHDSSSTGAVHEMIADLELRARNGTLDLDLDDAPRRADAALGRYD
jgi:hypothetical protein